MPANSIAIAVLLSCILRPLTSSEAFQGSGSIILRDLHTLLVSHTRLLSMQCLNLTSWHIWHPPALVLWHQLNTFGWVDSSRSLLVSIGPVCQRSTSGWRSNQGQCYKRFSYRISHDPNWFPPVAYDDLICISQPSMVMSASPLGSVRRVNESLIAIFHDASYSILHLLHGSYPAAPVVVKPGKKRR